MTSNIKARIKRRWLFHLRAEISFAHLGTCRRRHRRPPSARREDRKRCARLYKVKHTLLFSFKVVKFIRYTKPVAPKRVMRYRYYRCHISILSTRSRLNRIGKKKKKKRKKKKHVGKFIENKRIALIFLFYFPLLLFPSLPSPSERLNLMTHSRRVSSYYSPAKNSADRASRAGTRAAIIRSSHSPFDSSLQIVERKREKERNRRFASPGERCVAITRERWQLR
ncbi:hypothetical protein PUN28_003949 [Cardiocondyla obscurior]|uniref:Transmembrane protein n=1 Tax=Cardiocondyla obscurior TaxID=286306 RepID=A0AAW2GP25_9HYME